MPVSNWSGAVLSTMASIMKHERELTKLCGIKTLSQLEFGDVSLRSDVKPELNTDSFPVGSTYAIAKVYNGSITLVNGETFPLLLQEGFVLSAEVYIAARLSNIAAIEFMVTIVNSGTGLTYESQISIDFSKAVYSGQSTYLIECVYVSGTGGNASLHLQAAIIFSNTKWVSVSSGQDWSDKIALAKQILGLDLEKLLTDHGVKVDEEVGQVLLNVINNPQTFALSSDYKVIQLIYQDLSETSLNAELYSKKAEHYGRLYRDDLYKSWLRVNLDTSLSGTVDAYRADLIGELER